MVYAYHLVFGAHGFWLPNDPRGSWSVYVGDRRIYEIGGPATKTNDSRSLAKRPHDRDLRLATKAVLEYPPVRFDDQQAQAIMQGIEKYVARNGVTVWAAAIMPDHAHFVIARHCYHIEKVAELIKQNATKKLNAEDLHPFRDRPKENGRFHKCWAVGEWSVFLEDDDDILRAIAYVEQNPVKEGRPKQTWAFVKPFAGLETT